MVSVSAYRRPSTLAEAVELLQRPRTVVLAGGTRLNARSTEQPVEVVDLQALHLDAIEPEPGERLRIGAMATLQHLVDGDDVPEVVGEAARREQPSTLRAQATIGACVATGHPESELLAALLVHEAVVHLSSGAGTQETPLETLLAGLPLGPGRLVTSVTVSTGGRAAAFRTARTPADRPIVAAVGRATQTGLLVALTGVAPTPVLVGAEAELDPAGDFRGSGAYRRALADVLRARVLEAIA